MNKAQEFNVFDHITSIGIVPTLQFNSVNEVCPVIQAILDGGIDVVEIMLRNEFSIPAIKTIRAKYPNIVIGAGTVSNTEQVYAAQEAGAQFIVGPGFNVSVVKTCNSLSLPIIPGCVTAAEVESGIEMGLQVFKFFPAWQMGGTDTLNMLSGPYPHVRFIPTGSLNLKDIDIYLPLENVLAIGGDFMLWNDVVKKKDWARISNICLEAVARAIGFKLEKVTINDNMSSEDWARFMIAVAVQKQTVDATALNSSAEKAILYLSTLSVERAVRILKVQGFQLVEIEDNSNITNVIKTAKMLSGDEHIEILLTRRFQYEGRL